MRVATERGANLTAQLLAFSRRQRLEPKSVDLNVTVGAMRDMVQSTMSGAVRIETKLRSNLRPAIVDPTQMELAMLNRAINARDAMEVGGTLTIETANVTLLDPTCPEDPPTGGYVMVAVADTGTGIPPEVLDKVFERFFTTKEVGKGSGLGLAQVYGFAKQLGGGVHIDTRLGTGTTVKVYLPRSNFSAAQGSDSADTRRSVEPGTSSGGSVLVVDDDSAVREVTTAILEDLGYETLEAESGKAALAVLDREPHQQIDLLVLDFAMPGMNGAEVAREARRRRPNVPILFVTGFAEQAELMLAGVDTLMISIHRDRRHADVAVLLNEDIEMRRFPGWSMAYSGESAFVDGLIKALVKRTKPKPNTHQVRRLISVMTDCGQVFG